MTGPEKKPVVVVPKYTRKEVVFAVACGLGVLLFVGLGIMTMGSRQESAAANTLSGEVISKTFTPGAEEQVTFGSKGVKSRKLAGEYLLEVRVKSEARTFRVPVDQLTYEAAKVGDRQAFMRPRSERKE